jgi:hypothetical protein
VFATLEVDACVGVSNGFGRDFLGHGSGFLLRKVFDREGRKRRILAAFARGNSHKSIGRR